MPAIETPKTEVRKAQIDDQVNVWLTENNGHFAVLDPSTPFIGTVTHVSGDGTVTVQLDDHGGYRDALAEVKVQNPGNDFHAAFNKEASAPKAYATWR